MFTSVPLIAKSIEDYRSIISDEAIEHIKAIAEPLRGARVLHVNATAFGGGVAELLGAVVPLMQDLGIEADWQVMHGSDEFYAVTKAMHNALQGAFVDLNEEMRKTFLSYNRLNADLFDENYDYVVIHDPQPAAMLTTLQEMRGDVPGHWLWRCHIDLTAAQPDVWDFLRPYVQAHDGAIFTIPEYIKNDLTMSNLAIIPPSIDPLSAKNYELPVETIDSILQRYNIDPDRPIITQVSRFDPWKDPLGVIDSYRIVKSVHPEVQLILIASMAHDDPEGWSYYERTARHAGNDFNIFLLSNLNGVGNLEVNALQRSSDVVIQKSLREGFGLTVSEALWKKIPVVAGNVGGLPTQVISDRNGYLVNSVREAADRISELLFDDDRRKSFGQAGHEHVRKNFLTTAHVSKYLELFNELQNGDPSKSVHSARLSNRFPD